MRSRVALAFLLVLGFSVFASASVLSSKDVLNFVRSESLLDSGEQAQILPETTIASAGHNYWVAAVLENGSVSDFIPLSDEKEPGIPESGFLRRELLRTAFVLRSVLETKQSFDAQSSGWLFDDINVKFFDSFADSLRNEKSDILTAKSVLAGYPAVEADAGRLAGRLDSLVSMASSTGSGFFETEQRRREFFDSPDTNSLEQLRENFDSSFSGFFAFNDAVQAYLDDADKLKQAVASTGLSIEEKTSISNLLQAPDEARRLPSFSNIAVSLKQRISDSFDEADSKSLLFASKLETRVKKSSALKAINGRDDVLVRKTRPEFSSLSGAVAIVLAEENEFLWADQIVVAQLKDDWEKTQVFLKSGKYDLARSYAEKSKKDVVDVYSAGISEAPAPFDNGLLLGIAAILAALLVLLFVFGKRKKIAAALSQGPEEVDLNEGNPHY